MAGAIGPDGSVIDQRAFNISAALGGADPRKLAQATLLNAATRFGGASRQAFDDAASARAKTCAAPPSA